MEKILVATDLSVNSISAILFAYNLSQSRGATLVIVHIYHIPKPKSWRMPRFENHLKIRRAFVEKKMAKFLDQVFSNLESPIINYKIDLQMNSNTAGTIIKCAARHKCSHLCISTHGLGKNKDIIGDTSRRIMTKVPIPVFIIPSGYKETKLDRVCIVSDMSNYLKEIKKIADNGHGDYDDIRFLHIASAHDELIKTKQLNIKILKRTGIPVKSKYSIRNPSNSLLQDVDKAIKRIKPNLIIFFIDKVKPSQTKLYSVESPVLSMYKRIPLLLFKR